MEADLYDTDFHAWAEEQAPSLRALADGRTDAPRPVDWDHLIEEVVDLAHAQLRELRSRYAALIAQLLKWQFQPAMRSSSWRGSIVEQRNQIEDLLDENSSLKRMRGDVVAKVWPRARRTALAETELDDGMLPLHPIYTIDQLESFDFRPGSPVA